MGDFHILMTFLHSYKQLEIERLLQLFTDLSKDATIAVTELHTTAKPLAEPAIFGYQVRIA